MPRTLSTLLVMSVAVGFSSLAYPNPAHANEMATGEDDGASRSTLVKLRNHSGCVLTLRDAHVDRGKWTPDSDPTTKFKQIIRQDGAEFEAVPAGENSVAKNGHTSWESQSAGFMTGTAGSVEWQTKDCDETELDAKRVVVHWNNPFIGGNSYDFEVDPGLKAYLQNFDFNGKGENASASVTVGRAV